MGTCEHRAVLTHARGALPHDQDQGMGTPEEHVDQKQDEVLLVVIAHAVVDPRAVVVHASDATLARAAVVAQGNLDSLTFLAGA